MVDDTATFRRIFTGEYRDFSAVEADVKRFQRETATCFFRGKVVTVEGYRKSTGIELPDGYPYQYVQYKCVHSKRHNALGTRIHCYNCQARFSVVLKGICYEIGQAHLVHSHDFHVGKPWLYPRNRRLTADQESVVLSLMSGLQDTPGLRAYVSSQYGIHLNRSDLYQLRQRHRNVQANEMEEATTLLENQGPETTNAADEGTTHCTTVAATPHSEATVIDRTTNIRLVHEVLEDIAALLIGMDSDKFQQIFEVLTCIRDLLAADCDVALYATTSRCPDMLPLIRANISRLSGHERRPTATVTGVSLRNGTGSSTCDKEDMPTSVTATSMENPSVHTERTSKRKAPLCVRVTGPPEECNANSALKPRVLRTTSSNCYRKRWQHAAGPSTSTANVDCTACAVCLQEEDDSNRDSEVDWIMCDICGRWLHQSCAGYQNEPTYVCVFCCK